VKQGLAQLRVIDFTVGIAGAYCCHLLSDAGADVIKVEPPGGDPVRSWSMVPASVDPNVGSALFRFLHHGVRSVIGRPGDPDIDALVADADIVVEGFVDDTLDRRRLVQIFPGLVILSITPYGTDGPYADRPANDFVIQAESGGLLGRGSAHGAPFQAGGRTSEWIAAPFAAVAVTAAALRAQRTGHGEHIDCSVAEAMTIAASGYAEVTRQLLGNQPLSGVARRLETPSVEPTLDGYVGFCTNSREQFDSFLVLIERLDLLDTGEFAPALARQARWEEWTAIVRAWTMGRSTAEIVRAASQLRIPVAPVHDAAGLLGFEHFTDRRVFVPDPTGEFVMPRRPWRMDDEDPPPPRPSPVLGEHTGRIETRSPRRPAVPLGKRQLPLAGVRIMDLTAWWAGPMAAGVLAALGAEVIHVEGPTRIDGMRTTGGLTGLDGPWWERSAHYLCSNTNKRDLAIDLSRPEGLDLLKTLIARSDAVIENFSPRVLSNFGLDWETVHAINPECVLVRMPAFGLSGPWRDNTGFAQTMEHVTGLAWLTGHRSDQPRNQGGPSDPNAGMHAAFALLVGLAERDATQLGCHLEVTMVEAALNAAAELVIEFSAHGHRLERDGNRSPNAAPQGLYSCRGSDEWLAVSVTTDHEWEALLAVLGPFELSEAAQLATYEERRARHDELDEWIGAWAADRDAEEAVELLVAAGIPAGVGRDPRSLLEHPHLQFRRFHEIVEHPVVGRLAIPTVPFRFASVERWISTAAPLLGAHNREILADELGVELEHYQDLQEMGVIGHSPLVG